MKQILVILCLIIGTSWTTVSAQKVQSTSRSLTIIREPKVSLPHNCFVKAGAGILLGDSRTSYSSYQSGTSFKPNIAFGYQKQFTKQGLYWGTQAGFTFMPINYLRVGESFKGSPGIYLGPTFGIKKPISNSLEFDGHIGISGALSFNEGDTDFGPLWEVGAGVWINRFLIELMYQGFSSDTTIGTGILLNLGFKFI